MVELIPFFAILAYLIPFCVAAVRDHEQVTGVLLLNILAGWTVVGWWLALGWAFMGAERRPGQPPVPSRAALAPHPVMPRILDQPSGREGI